MNVILYQAVRRRMPQDNRTVWVSWWANGDITEAYSRIINGMTWLSIHLKLEYSLDYNEVDFYPSPMAQEYLDLKTRFDKGVDSNEL